MREMTFTAAAREGLAEEMARDATIFVVGEGIGARGGNFNTPTGLYDLYGPGRLRDTPIVLRGCYGVGGAAATHHSGAYYTIFAHHPGFRVAVPTTPRDAKGLLKTA